MKDRCDKQLKSSNFIHFISCGFGSGFSPKAPGTAGTVMAWCLWWPLNALDFHIYTSLLIFSIILGVYLCGKTAKDWKVHDHPSIVWDEFCGYWLTMLFAPANVYWSLYGFLLFRFFDIVKPWPIRWIDRRMGGGAGIMMDDLIAGLFSMLLIQATLFFLHG